VPITGEAKYSRSKEGTPWAFGEKGARAFEIGGYIVTLISAVATCELDLDQIKPFKCEPLASFSNDRARWLANAILPHEPALRRWLARKNIRGIEVDDLIQDTYAILAGMESVANIQNPKAYAYQTANSLVLIYLRRARVVSIQAVANIETIAGTDSSPSPEQVVADREELEKISDALEQLPARCREVFILRKIQGLSQREVAVRLGISEGTVEKQVHKGLEMLLGRFGRGGKRGPQASRGGAINLVEPHRDAGDERRNR
jgi:RNA polymerase sigma factor (sigma-70 family)